MNKSFVTVRFIICLIIFAYWVLTNILSLKDLVESIYRLVIIRQYP